MTAAGITPEKMNKVAFILKTIGHPVRLSIIGLLSEKTELSVGEICKSLDVEQSLVSHHLTNMKLKGILSSKREGKNIFYALALKEVIAVIECMSKCSL